MNDQPDTQTFEPQPPTHTHRRPGRAGIAAMAGAAILGVSGLAYAAQADDAAIVAEPSKRRPSNRLLAAAALLVALVGGI